MRLRTTGGLSVIAAALAACGAPPPAPAASNAATALMPRPSPTAAAEPPREPAKASGLGHLSFPITGSPECQRNFTEGMLALHSFLYDQAHVSFAAALAADTKCAMASWGDAMAYDKAIWDDRHALKGRAALARIGGEEALTPKERAFLRVARADYEKDLTKDAHSAWLAAAAEMHRDYPDDDEATLQYALALLANYGYDDAHVREQMEAGSLALQVLERNPEHPGAAHYAIHAFDSPDHAILALPAARLYARIAPAGSHALHMPSHVFAQLGMWRDVVSSNEQAYAASVAWEKSRGHSPSQYDWHSYSWLVAGHLELGQRAVARKLIEDARALLIASKDDSNLLREGYLDMVTNYVTQTRDWGDTEAMIAPVFAPAFDEGDGPGQVACAMHAPGGKGEARLPAVLIDRVDADFFRAEAAIRLGDEASAIKRIAETKELWAQTALWNTVLPATMAKRRDDYGASLLVRAHAGPKPSAAAQKKSTEALEKYMKQHPEGSVSGPAMTSPQRELYGEVLLAAGNQIGSHVPLDTEQCHGGENRAGTPRLSLFLPPSLRVDSLYDSLLALGETGPARVCARLLA